MRCTYHGGVSRLLLESDRCHPDREEIKRWVGLLSAALPATVTQEEYTPWRYEFAFTLNGRTEKLRLTYEGLPREDATYVWLHYSPEELTPILVTEFEADAVFQRWYSATVWAEKLASIYKGCG
jgi:hypothetical protein